MEFKKTLYSLMLGGLLLCLFSCAKEDEFEMPTLVLSENNITFNKNVDERNISVTTNQSNWTATSPQEGDWLSLIQDNNILKVKVKENLLGTERESYILINANGASGKIAIKQSAADVTLDVAPEAIYLPQRGGEKTVDITTNSSTYDVTTSEDVDWLKIVKSEEEIKLVAKRNESYEKREVKLYAKSGNVIREIIVSQPGIQRYILPIHPGVPQDEHKIMEYELARGSYLREYQAAMPAYGLEETYTFITPSPIFSIIQYCSSDGIAPSQFITIGDGQKAIDAVKDKAFTKFLIDNGYVRSNSQSDREYTNDKEFSQIHYKLKANTDPTAPYGRIHIFYTTDKNGDASDKLGSVQIGTLLFKDTSLGLWKYGTKWIATKEIKKLLGDEGFTFLRSSNNTHFFMRESDKLIIAITCVLDDNTPVLALLYSRDPSVSVTGSNSIKAQERMIKNFAAAKKALKF